MNWKCPDDWKHLPEAQEASDGTIIAMLFGGQPRWQHIRNLSFRRCNASGKWILPLQKAWCGVFGARPTQYLAYADQKRIGSYIVVWLNEDQYLIQKLKGNIWLNQTTIPVELWTAWIGLHGRRLGPFGRGGVLCHKGGCLCLLNVIKVCEFYTGRTVT